MARRRKSENILYIHIKNDEHCPLETNEETEKEKSIGCGGVSHSQNTRRLVRGTSTVAMTIVANIEAFNVPIRICSGISKGKKKITCQSSAKVAPVERETKESEGETDPMDISILVNRSAQGKTKLFSRYLLKSKRAFRRID